MDAEKLVTEGPPKGKEHRHPEQYYDNVIKGARLVADECAKDVIFEWMYSYHPVIWKWVYVRYMALVNLKYYLLCDRL